MDQSFVLSVRLQSDAEPTWKALRERVNHAPSVIVHRALSAYAKEQGLDWPEYRKPVKGRRKQTESVQPV